MSPLKKEPEARAAGPVGHTQGQGQHVGLSRILPLGLPVVLLVLALMLPNYMFWRGEPAGVNGLGPDAWPDAILNGLAFFSAVWLAQELWATLRGEAPALNAPSDDEVYSYRKALTGIALILGYGWLLQRTGFTLTTIGFILIWCLYGGIRKPVMLISVALIGTFVLLWVFMGLALMPLSRGMGVFDTFSIWMLQAVGIY